MMRKLELRKVKSHNYKYMDTKYKKQKRQRTHKRIRSTISGTESRPRLAVFRSNRYIYAQIINDDTEHTIISASDIAIDDKLNKVERAKIVGKKIGELAIANKIDTIVFDRGGFSYAGRVKALADAARESGLKF